MSAAATFETRDIDVLGIKVRVREMSARDGFRFAELARISVVADEKHGHNSPPHARANLDMLQFAVTACVVDENNRRVFRTDADREDIDNLNVEAVSEIASAAIELSFGRDEPAAENAA